MLNDHIQTATYYDRLTFTVSDEGNHQRAVNNSRLGLKQVARLTRLIAEKIDALYPSGKVSHRERDSVVARLPTR